MAQATAIRRARSATAGSDAISVRDGISTARERCEERWASARSTPRPDVARTPCGFGSLGACPSHSSAGHRRVVLRRSHIQFFNFDALIASCSPDALKSPGHRIPRPRSVRWSLSGGTTPLIQTLHNSSRGVEIILSRSAAATTPFCKCSRAATVSRRGMSRNKRHRRSRARPRGGNPAAIPLWLRAKSLD
jgi:hypothetical protein